MPILSDKASRRQMAVISLALLCLILSGWILAVYATNDYRRAMIDHDYAIAGYLLRQGLDRAQVSLALTSEKTDEDLRSGMALLEAAGYDGAIRDSLLPEVAGFRRRHTWAAFASSTVLSLILLGVFYTSELRRNARLEKARREISRLAEGDTSVRLDDSGEGALACLLSAVNTMGTSLASHIQLERQRKEFLKDTISDISHQLKTPLAAIQMYNDIVLEETADNHTVKEFLLKSQREAARMGSLIQSLLRLARLDAGTIEIERSPHDLGRFLEQCVDGFRARARQEGKDLSLRLGHPVTLSFDETWLEEAVGNIIKNALDHTGPGDRIEVSLVETPVMAEIEVRDSGAGIHPEDIHHIFKRFYRSRFSKDRQGAGIGLALSKAIVERHGGLITVESEPLKGASFHLVFPKVSSL